MKHEESPLFFHDEAEILAKALSNVKRKTLKDQTYEISVE